MWMLDCQWISMVFLCSCIGCLLLMACWWVMTIFIADTCVRLATEAKNPNKRAVAGDVFRFTPWISLIRTVLEWCRHLHTPKVRWVPQNQLMWAWNSVTILYSESTFQSGRSLIETCFFQKDPAEGFSQRIAAKFNFVLHLHSISYILCSDIIYNNFISSTSHTSSTSPTSLTITFTSPTSSISTSSISHTSSTPTSSTGAERLHISYKTSTMSFPQEFLHRTSYTGLLTQEFLHRSSFTGVLPQKLSHRSSCTSSYTEAVPRKLFHRSSSTGVLAQEFLRRSCCTGFLHRSCLTGVLTWVLTQEILHRS